MDRCSRQVCLDGGADAGGLQARRYFYVDVGSGDDAWDGRTAAHADAGQGPWQHLPGTIGVTGAGWVPLIDGDLVFVKGDTVNPVAVGIGALWYQGQPAFDSVRIVGGQRAVPPWGFAPPVFDEELARTFGFWFDQGGGGVVGVTLDGVEVENVAGGGVGPGFDTTTGSAAVVIGGQGTVRYLTVRGCSLHDTVHIADDTGHGVGVRGGDHLIIEGNTIGPNVGGSGIAIVDADQGVIRRNWIEGSADHAMALAVTRFDVAGNVVKMTPPLLGESYAMKLYGNGNGEGNNDVWNNLLFTENPTLPSPADDRPQGIGIFSQSNDRFYENTVFSFANSGNSAQYGTCIALGAEAANTSGDEVQNNIAFDCVNSGNVQVWMGTNVSSAQLRFNDFFSPDSGTVAQLATSLYTVAQLDMGGLPGGSLASDNLQAAPGLAGGALPTGLDAQQHPNTGYFRPSASSPPALRATQHALSGDATHGYSADPGKFSTDITGAPRTGWSMGAYEAAP